MNHLYPQKSLLRAYAANISQISQKISLVFVSFCLINSSVVAGNGKQIPTGNSGILRTNLYLLDGSNMTTLADGNLTEFDVPYSDLVLLEDAVKFTNINENLGLKRHGVTLAVERRPALSATDTLFMQLWKTTQRSYQFEFIPSNLSAYNLMAFLEDTYLNTSTPLSLINSTFHNFSVDADPASANRDRFRVVFRSVTPLAVHFSSFSAAIKTDASKQLDWVISNPSDVVKFDVQRSTDGIRFQSVSILSVNGNSGVTHFSYIDLQAATGKTYYRILATERSGAIRFSSIISATTQSGNGNVTVYPNPVKGNNISFIMNNMPVGQYRVAVLSFAGQSVYSQSILFNGQSVYTLSLKSALAEGVYYLRITQPDGVSITKQLLVQ